LETPLRLVSALVLLVAINTPASGRPKLEWRTLYFSLNGPTFVFQERPDEVQTEDCSTDNEGRPCFVSTWVREEPCVPGSASTRLLKRLWKSEPSPSGTGQFLVEELPPPWAKLYPEFVWEMSPGQNQRFDEYALVRGVRVYPQCDKAPTFYWVHDFRILELNRYDPETGAKLPNWGSVGRWPRHKPFSA